jgi:hypothetical protein
LGFRVDSKNNLVYSYKHSYKQQTTNQEVRRMANMGLSVAGGNGTVKYPGYRNGGVMSFKGMKNKRSAKKARERKERIILEVRKKQEAEDREARLQDDFGDDYDY